MMMIRRDGITRMVIRMNDGLTRRTKTKRFKTIIEEEEEEDIKKSE